MLHPLAVLPPELPLQDLAWIAHPLQQNRHHRGLGVAVALALVQSVQRQLLCQFLRKAAGYVRSAGTVSDLIADPLIDRRKVFLFRRFRSGGRSLLW